MFNKPNALIALVAIGLIIAAPVSAENEVEDFHTWAGIEMSGDFSSIYPAFKKFKYKLFAQGRFGDNSTRFTQALIRPGIGYTINEKATVWLGYDWVPTSLLINMQKLPGKG